MAALCGIKHEKWQKQLNANKLAVLIKMNQIKYIGG